jgi:hypothetical protein
MIGKTPLLNLRVELMERLETNNTFSFQRFQWFQLFQ